MKKLILIALILTACLSLCSCGQEIDNTAITENESRFVVVFEDFYVTVYMDKQTGVQYFSKHDAGTCVVVDEDGKPLIGGQYD